MQTRIVTFELAERADEGIPATLSTEAPVDRGSYQEILEHTDDAIQIRGDGSSLPLLIGHASAEPPVGRVTDIHVRDRALKGTLRLGASQRARELLTDIQRGVVDSLSIGYRILEKVTSDGELRATAWEIFEASLVGVPADPQAGTYRSEEENPVSNTDRAARRERQRISEIASYRDQYDNIDDLVDHAIDNGAPVDDFREAVAERKRSLPVTLAPNVEQPREYSIVSGIRGALDPRERGYEHELSDELSRAYGPPRTPNGFWLPMPDASERVMTAATAGASTIQTTVLERIVDFIIRASVWPNLGIVEFNGLTSNLQLPKGTSSVTTAFLSLDGSTNITESTPTLSSVTLSPTSLASFVQISHKMLLQSGASVEQYLRSLMGRAIGNQLDLSVFSGSGSSNQPTGVENASGVNSVTYTTTPTWADILNTVEALETDAVSLRNCVWIINPAQISDLGSTEKATNTAQFLMDFGSDRNGAFGTMAGFPVYVSEHVTSGTYMFGAFEHSALGFFGPIEIAVDQNYDFQKGNIAIRAILDFDYEVVNAEGFALLTAA